MWLPICPAMLSQGQLKLSHWRICNANRCVAIAVLELKGQLYCASSRSFINPDASKSDLRRRKRRSEEKKQHTGCDGLVNIGITCYMSLILQASAHNPMLSLIFLLQRVTACVSHR